MLNFCPKIKGLVSKDAERVSLLELLEEKFYGWTIIFEIRVWHEVKFESYFLDFEFFFFDITRLEMITTSCSLILSKNLKIILVPLSLIPHDLSHFIIIGFNLNFVVDFKSTSRSWNVIFVHSRLEWRSLFTNKRMFCYFKMRTKWCVHNFAEWKRFVFTFLLYMYTINDFHLTQVSTQPFIYLAKSS